MIDIMSDGNFWFLVCSIGILIFVKLWTRIPISGTRWLQRILYLNVLLFPLWGRGGDLWFGTHWMFWEPPAGTETRINYFVVVFQLFSISFFFGLGNEGRDLLLLKNAEETRG